MFNNNRSNLATATTRYIQYIQTLREKKVLKPKILIFRLTHTNPCKENEVTEIFEAYTKKMKTSTDCLKTLIW
jgi:hypothetical protein